MQGLSCTWYNYVAVKCPRNIKLREQRKAEKHIIAENSNID